MTCFVGGMLDGTYEPTSPAEEATLPDTLFPTATLRKCEVGGMCFRQAVLDKPNEPRKPNVGPYIRDDDGRYYHSTHRGYVKGAK